MQGGDYFKFEHSGDEATFKFDIGSEEMQELLKGSIMEVLEKLDEANSKDVLKAAIMLSINMSIQIFLHKKNAKGAALSIWALRGIANNFHSYEEFTRFASLASETTSKILSDFLQQKMVEIYDNAGEDHFMTAVRQWSEKSKKKGPQNKKGPSGFDFKKTFGI